MPGRGTPWRKGKGRKGRVAEHDIEDDSVESIDIKDGTIQEVDLDSALQAKVNSASGHVIEDEGTPLAQRPNMNFIGAGVVASDDGETTNVTIAGGGGGGIDLLDTALLREEFDWSDPTLVFVTEKYALLGSGNEIITNGTAFGQALYGINSLFIASALLGSIAELESSSSFLVEPFISDIIMTQIVLLRSLTTSLYVCAMMGSSIGALLLPTTDTNFFVENEEGFGFIYDPNTSTNWQIFSATAGSVTKVTTTVAGVAGGARTKLRAIYDKTVPKVDFEIGGVNVGTITTNIPNPATDTLACYSFVGIISGAGFDALELDFWEVQADRV